jgi:hypothetical protein
MACQAIAPGAGELDVEPSAPGRPEDQTSLVELPKGCKFRQACGHVHPVEGTGAVKYPELSGDAVRGAKTRVPSEWGNTRPLDVCDRADAQASE